MRFNTTTINWWECFLCFFIGNVICHEISVNWRKGRWEKVYYNNLYSHIKCEVWTKYRNSNGRKWHRYTMDCSRYSFEVWSWYAVTWRSIALFECKYSKAMSFRYRAAPTKDIEWNFFGLFAFSFFMNIRFMVVVAVLLPIWWFFFRWYFSTSNEPIQ